MPQTSPSTPPDPAGEAKVLWTPVINPTTVCLLGAVNVQPPSRVPVVQEGGTPSQRPSPMVGVVAEDCEIMQIEPESIDSHPSSMLDMLLWCALEAGSAVWKH